MCAWTATYNFVSNKINTEISLFKVFMKFSVCPAIATNQQQVVWHQNVWQVPSSMFPNKSQNLMDQMINSLVY